MRPQRFTFFIAVLLLFSCNNHKGDYVCTPCDLPCDKIVFHKAGVCPECNMDLIKKSDLIPEEELVLNHIDIQDGSGKFLIEGSTDTEKSIIVHYYKPSSFSSESPIIYVLPGAGRNGDDYRDTWIEHADKYSLLVLSPEYTEELYPGFWNYNLAGMINNVNITDKTFDVNNNASDWLFSDMDRIFDSVRASLKFQQNQYDMFGHSAGGQFIHRLAIFKPNTKVNRMLAANSGWYTTPTDTTEFPFGLDKNTLSEETLDFSSNLTIFLGEDDNAKETRGHLRRGPNADKQGLHRLQRGKYFYNTSKEIAEKLNKNFNWSIKVIPNIGHDYRGMSEAAALFLYNKN